MNESEQLGTQVMFVKSGNVTFFYVTCLLISYFHFSLSSEGGGKNCGNVLLQRSQEKAGFHRDVLTNIEWDLSSLTTGFDVKNCQLLLLEHLPNGIYVDPDQIRNGEEFGGPQVFSRDVVNVESMAHHSTVNQIFVVPKTMIRSRRIVIANISLPIHLRYHRAALNKTFVSVILSSPTVLGRCNGIIEHLGTHCASELTKAPCVDKTGSVLCDWFILKSASEGQPLTSDPLVFYVPVGQREHLWSVISLTVLSTMTGCAVVVWSAIAKANPL